MSKPTALPWVKLYTDDDVDWLGVPIEVRAVFYELLKLGGRAWPRGVVKGQDAGVAARIGAPLEVFTAAVELLSSSQYRSLRRIAGGVRIVNWHKYQTPADSLSRAQRGDGGKMVASHPKDGVTDGERERERERRGREEPWLVEALAELERVADYPFNATADTNYLLTLVGRYPRVDPLEAVRGWTAYKLDRPLQPGESPRSQLNTWFRNCIEYGRALKGDMQPVETADEKRARLEAKFARPNLQVVS